MRVIGWEERLLAVLDRHARAPFGWGQSDCFVLPADAVAALTGADPWADHRGYADALGAARALHAHGMATVADAFAARLASVAPALARRGDIGVADYPGAELGGGVVVLGPVLIGKGETGTVRLPRVRLLHAFKVGW